VINPYGHSKISAKRNLPDFECQTLPCSNGRLPAPCLHERPRTAKDPAETADDPRYGAARQLLPPNRRCDPPIPLALLQPANGHASADVPHYGAGSAHQGQFPEHPTGRVATSSPTYCRATILALGFPTSLTSSISLLPTAKT
jgi:hypothetical protein